MHQDIDQQDAEPKARRRIRLPASHPFLAEIEIDPADWYRFNNLNNDTPATKIVTYDDPQDGLMLVYVACSSEEVRRRLTKGWA